LPAWVRAAQGVGQGDGKAWHVGTGHAPGDENGEDDRGSSGESQNPGERSSGGDWLPQMPAQPITAAMNPLQIAAAAAPASE